jgi:hypothetical protein
VLADQEEVRVAEVIEIGEAPPPIGVAEKVPSDLAQRVAVLDGVNADGGLALRARPWRGRLGAGPSLLCDLESVATGLLQFLLVRLRTGIFGRDLEPPAGFDRDLNHDGRLTLLAVDHPGS